MRTFIFREWDKSEDKNWIKDLAYVGGKNSDYALLLPICVNDERFKPYIRQCYIRGNYYTNFIKDMKTRNIHE